MPYTSASGTARAASRPARLAHRRSDRYGMVSGPRADPQAQPTVALDRYGTVSGPLSMRSLRKVRNAPIDFGVNSLQAM